MKKFLILLTLSLIILPFNNIFSETTTKMSDINNTKQVNVDLNKMDVKQARIELLKLIPDNLKGMFNKMTDDQIKTLVSQLYDATVKKDTTVKDSDSKTTDKTTTKTVKNLDEELFNVCIQNAIAKRDTKISDLLDAENKALKTEIQNRVKVQKIAITIKDSKEKSKIFEDLAKTYKTNIAKAKSIFTKGKDDAWTQYVKDRKSCGAAKTEESSNINSLDSSL